MEKPTGFDAWPEAAQQAWEAAAADLENAQQRSADAEAKRAAAAGSPEAALLAMRAQADEARRAADAAERELADEQAWLEAQAKYGARCGRIFTAGGSLILKANTAEEWDGIQARAEALQAAALEAGDVARASADVVKAYREGVLTKSRVHPDTQAARKIVADFPGVWTELFGMRDALNRGPRAAAGKDVAR